MNEVFLHLGIPILVALLLTVILCFALTPMAHHFGWLDTPNHRKQHSGDIPLVGGPAIVLAVTAVMFWQGGWSTSATVLGWSAAIVFLTGLIDDRRHIPVPIRFALQILALLGMIWYGDVVLNNFGKLMWDGVVNLGPGAIPITVFSALGVINAFNMIDGMDGLSGSLALIALGGMAFLAGLGGFVEAHSILLIVCGAILGFLLMNFRFPWREKALVFLGDSGSSWIGFVLAWFFIALSQDNPASGVTRAYAPIVAIWLFGLPLMDTTYVMIRRAREGVPIFEADRHHLHHVFLRSGFSVCRTWVVMVGAALVMAFIGIVGQLNHWPEWGMFYSYVGLALAYLFWMNRTWKTRRFMGKDLI